MIIFINYNGVPNVANCKFTWIIHVNIWFQSSIIKNNDGIKIIMYYKFIGKPPGGHVMNSNGYNVGKIAFESCEFADCGEPGTMPLNNKGSSINITKCKFIYTNSECLGMILGMMRSSTNANSIWRRCYFHRISQRWLQNVHSFSLIIKSKSTMADSFQVTNMKNEPTIEINTFQNDKYMISIIYH